MKNVTVSTFQASRIKTGALPHMEVCFISLNILGRWETLQLGQTVRLTGRRFYRPPPRRQCQPAVMEAMVPISDGPIIDSSAQAPWPGSYFHFMSETNSEIGLALLLPRQPLSILIIVFREMQM
jgi:hypothetical protein